MVQFSPETPVAWGARVVGPGRAIQALNEGFEFLSDVIVPEGKLKVRKADGTLEDFTGGSFASPAFRYVRVAHGAAAPTLAGGTPGKDWRGGAFENRTRRWQWRSPARLVARRARFRGLRLLRIPRRCGHRIGRGDCLGESRENATGRKIRRPQQAD